jgi:enoyl-CoA hydratase/carnithine racemase
LCAASDTMFGQLEATCGIYASSGASQRMPQAFG